MKHFSQFFLLVLLVISCTDNGTGKDSKYDTIVKVLPDIGQYMIKPDSSGPALWLDRKQPDGRYIQEPINIIIVDRKASDIGNAAARLVDAFTKAGFGPRYGHSSGYHGKMNGLIYNQQPSTNDYAFSDYMWAFSNNHARIFGPFLSGSTYIWIGSSSREKGISHDYVSFIISRNAMAEAMTKYSGAELAGSYFLDNKLDNQDYFTGDHDGFAPVIILK